MICKDLQLSEARIREVGLSSVAIGTNVSSIGSQAFYDCTNLTNAAIPGSVTNIGYLAFYGCPLNIVTIPANVGSIGTNAFNGPLTSAYFEGDAPQADASVFAGDKATVYFLPGTKGWGSTFGGVPTAIWTPQLHVDNTAFRARTNQFGLNITWASGKSIVVEASANLSLGNWIPLATNTLTGGSLFFTDPGWTNYPSRFYRARPL